MTTETPVEGPGVAMVTGVAHGARYERQPRAHPRGEVLALEWPRRAAGDELLDRVAPPALLRTNLRRSSRREDVSRWEDPERAYRSAAEVDAVARLVDGPNVARGQDAPVSRP